MRRPRIASKGEVREVFEAWVTLSCSLRAAVWRGRDVGNKLIRWAVNRAIVDEANEE